MSYRQILQKQIKELEEKIASSSQEKEELQKQLDKLRLAEFEEDERESGYQLLNG